MKTKKKHIQFYIGHYIKWHIMKTCETIRTPVPSTAMRINGIKILLWENKKSSATSLSTSFNSYNKLIHSF